MEFEIEQHIIIGGTSSKIRKRALRDPQFALKDMLLEGRRDEQSTYQVKDIESKDVNAETNKITTHQGKSLSNELAGTVDVITPTKAVAQQLEKYVINVEN